MCPPVHQGSVAQVLEGRFPATFRCLSFKMPESNNQVISQTLDNLADYWGGNLVIWFRRIGQGTHLNISGYHPLWTYTRAGPLPYYVCTGSIPPRRAERPSWHFSVSISVLQILLPEWRSEVKDTFEPPFDCLSYIKCSVDGKKLDTHLNIQFLINKCSHFDVSSFFFYQWKKVIKLYL